MHLNSKLQKQDVLRHFVGTVWHRDGGYKNNSPSVIILHFSESLKRHLPGELENWKGLQI